MSLAYRHRRACSGQEENCGERSSMVAHNERTGIEEADALVDGAAAVPQVYERMSWACRPSHIGSLLGGALLPIVRM